MSITRSPLVTWTSGERNGAPVLVLHDRYKDQEELAGLPPIPGAHRPLRSARTQMTGTDILGFFWFIGPPERPELTTFGDGLHHLETLLLDASAEAGGKRGLVIGKGEGGVMALVLATVWPELLAGVVSIDGPLPVNLGHFPLEARPPTGLPVLLIERGRMLGDTAAALSTLGASVEVRRIAEDDPLPAAADWLTARLTV